MSDSNDQAGSGKVLDAMPTDTAMLNWLESIGSIEVTADAFEAWDGRGGEPKHKASDLRSAIAAAMKGDQP